MKLLTIRTLLLIAGALAIPLLTISVILSSGSGYIVGIDDAFKYPLPLLAIEVVIVFLAGFSTSTLCWWCASNIKPFAKLTENHLIFLLSASIFAEFIIMALSLVQLALNMSYYEPLHISDHIAYWGYAFWSIVAALIYIPVLLFARKQLQLKLAGASVSEDGIKEVFS